MYRITKNTKSTSSFHGNVTQLSNGDWMPQVGMLGTEYSGSDRYAVVCLSVNSPKRITVGKLSNIDENTVENHPNIEIDDNGIMWLKNIADEPTYSIETWSFRTNKRGRQVWKEMGKDGSSYIHWGKANPYRDPDF